MRRVKHEVTRFTSVGAEESDPMSVEREPPATAPTTTQTTLVMEVDDEVERDFSSSMLDDLSARLWRKPALKERAGTVEEAHAHASGNGVENDYTICFGVFLRDLRMQRVYLDGYARLHKNHVYLGLVLFVVLLLVYAVQHAFVAIGQRKWCSNSESPKSDWVCEKEVAGGNMAEYFQDVYPESWKYSYSELCGFSVLGGVTNWLLHSRFCEKVKEKSWAMLAVFLCPYVGFCIYGMWSVLGKLGFGWMWYVFLSLTLTHRHTFMTLHDLLTALPSISKANLHKGRYSHYRGTLYLLLRCCDIHPNGCVYVRAHSESGGIVRCHFEGYRGDLCSCSNGKLC